MVDEITDLGYKVIDFGLIFNLWWILSHSFCIRVHTITLKHCG